MCTKNPIKTNKYQPNNNAEQNSFTCLRCKENEKNRAIYYPGENKLDNKLGVVQKGFDPPAVIHSEVKGHVGGWPCKKGLASFPHGPEMSMVVHFLPLFRHPSASNLVLVWFTLMLSWSYLPISFDKRNCYVRGIMCCIMCYHHPSIHLPGHIHMHFLLPIIHHIMHSTWE